MVDDLVSRVLSAITRLEQRAESPANLVATFMTAVISPDQVLRLCQSLRDIVTQYKAAEALPELLVADRAHGLRVLQAESAAKSWRAALLLVARGLGIDEDTERSMRWR